MYGINNKPIEWTKYVTQIKQKAYVNRGMRNINLQL